MKTRTPKERAERKKKKTARAKMLGKIPKKEKCPSVAELDRLFSLYVRARSVQECQLYGYGGIVCSSQMQCSHIKSRKYHSVRWNPLNAITACAAHHRLQHDQPDQNYLWLLDLLGEDHLEQLHCAWLNGKKPTPDEKRAIKAFLKAELERMNQ